MLYSAEEIVETLSMLEDHHLDIRTVTLGVSLLGCQSGTMAETVQNISRRILGTAGQLQTVVNQVSEEFGIPVANKRLSVSPIGQAFRYEHPDQYFTIAKTLDTLATEIGIDFIGGFTAKLEGGGIGVTDKALLKSLPKVLNETDSICASISVASTSQGINLEAIAEIAPIILDTAWKKLGTDAKACGKLVVFCNQPGDNPFIAGAVHGSEQGDSVLHVGVSGPGVVRNIVASMPDAPIQDISNAVKEAAYKITRMGELTGQEVAKRLGVRFGCIDLSLAPTPAQGDSIAEILEQIGLERCGTHGTIAALALLNDAVKKGGAMAATRTGGLSGAFIPVMEDSSMAQSAAEGTLTLDKLEAMTCVCSVGLDMIPIPGDTPADTIAAIIADEMAIGMINNKTTAARLIPVPNKGVGEWIDFGGLWGAGPIMPVKSPSSTQFIQRRGHIPPPIQSLTN